MRSRSERLAPSVSRDLTEASRFPNRREYDSLCASRRGTHPMGRPIEITRDEHSATALRELAARTHDGAVVRRLGGIALILEGHPREAAARLSGTDRQTLSDWAHRYNADGVAGLSSRCSRGRPPALSGAEGITGIYLR